MSKYYMCSVSWGKDSLAMLLKLIELKEPIDEVVFYDTGMEFQAIYNLRDKVIPLLAKRNIKYTELKPKRAFRDTMYNYKRIKRDGSKSNGYGWCGGMCRWGTSEKISALDKYAKSLNAVVYIGIAADEKSRIAKERLKFKKMPLVEWGMNEEECLQYCYSKGYNWKENDIELYSILSRVSCWCCRNKNLTELKNYKLYLPQYYEKLKELENIISEPMKKPTYLKDRFRFVQNDLFEKGNENE